MIFSHPLCLMTYACGVPPHLQIYPPPNPLRGGDLCGAELALHRLLVVRLVHSVFLPKNGNNPLIYDS